MQKIVIWPKDEPNSATWSYFLDVKTTFCAYDRKITDDDKDGFNDHYDSNDGNFDGKNIQILYVCMEAWLCSKEFPF